MTQELLKDLEKGSKSALIKKRIINYYIYNGNSTITDLSKVLDLSVPTVTKFIDEMCLAGYLNVYGKLETNGGRHPHLYGLNPESGYFIGVDIKRHALNIGLINFNGDLLESQTDIPYKFENTKEGLDKLCSLVKDFIDSLVLDKEKILNIDVNVSGRVNPESGYSYSWFNFGEEPLTTIMSKKIGYQVSIDNDTRAMTYGEFLRGNINAKKNILFVNISWGLGLGMIIDGKIYSGKSGFAGEFGHIAGYDNEIICHCGKKGCLETEASGNAIYRKLLERVRNGENTILAEKLKSNEDDISLETIIDAVNNDDTLCIELVEEVGYELGKHIAGLINIFNPELVVIGGILSLTGDYITQPIKTAIRKHSLNLVNKDTRITTSILKDKAGMVGACMLARSRIFEDQCISTF